MSLCSHYMTVLESRVLTECQCILSSQFLRQEWQNKVLPGRLILMQPSDIAEGNTKFSQDSLYVGTVAGGRRRILEGAGCLICKWSGVCGEGRRTCAREALSAFWGRHALMCRAVPGQDELHRHPGIAALSLQVPLGR